MKKVITSLVISFSLFSLNAFANNTIKQPETIGEYAYLWAQKITHDTQKAIKVVQHPLFKQTVKNKLEVVENTVENNSVYKVTSKTINTLSKETKKEYEGSFLQKNLDETSKGIKKLSNDFMNNF